MNCRWLLARNAVSRAEYYFRAARPLLLKDFFDPKNGKTPRIQKPLKMTGINFVVEGYEVKQFALMDGV